MPPIMNIAELFGYIASFFVAISLVMNRLLWLRVLNLIGAVAFVVYGLMLNAVPVLITNGFIVLIDIVYLVRMFRPNLNGVQYVSVGPERRPRIDEFIARYQQDILSFFPDFSAERVDRCFASGGRVYLAMKDLSVVGFALVQPVPEPEHERDAALRKVYTHMRADLFPGASVMVPVDYITRRYRGLGLVHQLYKAIEFDERENAQFLLAPVRVSARRHQRFLRSLGFQEGLSTESYVVFGKALSA